MSEYVKVAHPNGWEISVRREVAENPEKRDKIIEMLRKVGEIEGRN